MKRSQLNAIRRSYQRKEQEEKKKAEKKSTRKMLVIRTSNSLSGYSANITVYKSKRKIVNYYGRCEGGEKLYLCEIMKTDELRCGEVYKAWEYTLEGVYREIKGIRTNDFYAREINL